MHLLSLAISRALVVSSRMANLGIWKSTFVAKCSQRSFKALAFSGTQPAPNSGTLLVSLMVLGRKQKHSSGTQWPISEATVRAQLGHPRGRSPNAGTHRPRGPEVPPSTWIFCALAGLYVSPLWDCCGLWANSMRDDASVCASPQPSLSDFLSLY